MLRPNGACAQTLFLLSFGPPVSLFNPRRIQKPKFFLPLLRLFPPDFFCLRLSSLPSIRTAASSLGFRYPSFSFISKRTTANLQRREKSHAARRGQRISSIISKAECLFLLPQPFDTDVIVLDKTTTEKVESTLLSKTLSDTSLAARREGGKEKIPSFHATMPLVAG